MWAAPAEQGKSVLRSPELTHYFHCLAFLGSVCHVVIRLCSRRSGAAVTLVTRDNWRMAPELISILERAGQVRFKYK